MTPKRLAYAALGLAAAAVAIVIVVTQHTAWWPAVVLAIAPDVALVAGMSAGLQRGQLHPRAVPLYNAVHRFWAPAVLLVVALALHQLAWAGAGLAWIAHVSVDRSLGFGLRTREGFERG